MACSDEVGPSWSRAKGSADFTAAFKSAGKARPPEFDKTAVQTHKSLQVDRREVELHKLLPSELELCSMLQHIEVWTDCVLKSCVVRRR